jgi:hypothetical protein
MPIIITFDQEGAGSNDLNRIHSMFLRFGWQNLGSSTYRYPHTDREGAPEDWLNHVVPALMLLRSYFTTTGRVLHRFTIDSHTSAVFTRAAHAECAPRNAQNILCESHKQEFGEKKLLQWLSNVVFPYDGTDR